MVVAEAALKAKCARVPTVCVAGSMGSGMLVTRRATGARRICVGSLAACGLVAGCSQPNNGSVPSGASTVTPTPIVNAGPRKSPPSGLYGKKWKSRPSSDLKVFAPPTDGITIYVPKGQPEAFEGIPVAEADLEYDRGHLLSGDLYVDGAERRDAVRDALAKLYGSPDAKPTTGNDYSWSWPKQRIAVDMRFDPKHTRTTVTFSSATKDRSTADLPQIAVPTEMDMMMADDMSKAAHNMKLAILDGNRKDACSNAKSLYYDRRSLARSGAIQPAQRKAMTMADRFIHDQCPR